MPTAVGVSVLLSDLVGSIALLRAAISAHAGREVKNLGDGLLVAFPGAGAALETRASEILRSL